MDHEGQAQGKEAIPEGSQMNAPNRRYSVNEQVGPFVISVGFTQDHRGEWTVPLEAFISARGRSGTELDDHLYEIGVRISKLMQGE